MYNSFRNSIQQLDKHMKKILFTLLLFVSTWSSVAVTAQTLKFNAAGKFKIAQFTDIHYIQDDARSQVALERIAEVLDAERPDLIMLTGDIIYGKPAEKSLRTVLDLVAKYKIPFAITFGNHDDEHGVTRSELLKIIQSYPHNLTAQEAGLSGVSNFILPVKTSDGKKNGAVLYCLDSNSYSQIKGVSGYDYIKFDQVQWYREQSAAFTKENASLPVPSYAFFHIALPEYHEAVAHENTTLVGTRMEKTCAPELNSGMFAAMKEMGDVKGVFVGHDHDNDYAVYWKGILLAYGRYSGGNTVYNHLPNGARIIELNQNSESFDTWIHLKNGVIINKVSCPSSFLRK